MIDVRPESHAIHPDDVAGCPIDSPRVLFRTRDGGDRTKFPEPFTCLTPELVDWLAAHGVILVGLDTPSVDRVDSKDLPCHKALFRHGIVNLESLELGAVPEGRYELIALPLRLAGRDASPVRAVLRELDNG